MALRHLSTRLLPRLAASGQAARYAVAAPSVYDKMVQVTVVDGTGRRFPIRGMEGQTLVELLENQEGPLDVSDYMCLKPSGRGEHECVVHVPNEFTRRLTPPGFEDFKELEQISEGAITPNTRLGSSIVMTRDLNDMLVSLGPILPWNTL